MSSRREFVLQYPVSRTIARSIGRSGPFVARTLELRSDSTHADVVRLSARSVRTGDYPPLILVLSRQDAALLAVELLALAATGANLSTSTAQGAQEATQ